MINSFFLFFKSDGIIVKTGDKKSLKWQKISLLYDLMQAEATTGLMY